MSDIIQLLPDSVANQIAAGEVIQRPSSAVKELIENAIDAGANDIQLYIKDAGRTLIQVIDNGCGMSATDARLCFERHATSKIRTADDIFHIRTMGFRGEALASIAAIAHVELKTRMHDQELGSLLTIAGSEIKDQSFCESPVGTSIAVKNLFFNVPARRSFLKTDSIEYNHIEEEFIRTSLVNCDISFSLHHNGKPAYKLPRSNFQQRIVNIFGESFKKKLLPVKETTQLLTLEGFVSKIDSAKKTKNEQYFFVNKRFIKHPYLCHAVEQAYQDLIPEKMHPSFFIQLEVDPSRIDVNIHPTKTEVKFLDERILYSILRSAVKKTLGQFTLSPQFDFEPVQCISFDTFPKNYIPKEPSIRVDTTYNPFTDKKIVRGDREPLKSETALNQWNKLIDQQEYATEQTSDPSKNTEKNGETLFEKEEIDTGLRTSPNDVIQIQNSYLVTEITSGLLIIDQQRAHERILFEHYTNKESSAVSTQQLIFPETCRFSSSDADLLKEICPEIKALGFDLEELNQTTFVIKGIPSEMKTDSIQEILEEVLSLCKNNLLHKFSNKEQSVLFALAKKLSIKKNTRLKQEEMQSLIANLFSCSCPDISPDGKKIMILFDKNSLSEKFK